ncbi:AraC family transcriptional regulator, transcriptional activator of pobA [Thioclava dalianensis]|nr:AraC family transcriptional regulator [Thioclava dalianensis]SFN73403.1 AraC family transcriptional regulator, transcriptional activator of pobA [Thioclava dalianensis]
MGQETVTSMLRVERIEPSIRTRIYEIGKGAFERFGLIAVLRRGQARLVLSESDMTVGAHSVLLLPHTTPARLEVPAGTDLWLIGFARRLQPLVTGAGPESLPLDQLLNRVSLTPPNRAQVEASILPLLPLLVDEITDPEKRSQMAGTAILRLMLIAIGRMLHRQEIEDSASDNQILLRFRQLVELGYHTRKSVAEYCDALSLTYDRLHDICQRSLNRPPLELIHQRVLLDASTWLSRTDESIQSIAERLGFDDPSKFSHFFKRATGMSPSQYRKSTRLEAALQTQSRLKTFSDWP